MSVTVHFLASNSELQICLDNPIKSNNRVKFSEASFIYIHCFAAVSYNLIVFLSSYTSASFMYSLYLIFSGLIYVLTLVCLTFGGRSMAGDNMGPANTRERAGQTELDKQNTPRNQTPAHYKWTLSHF